MSNTRTTFAALLASSLALSGCSSIFGLHIGHSDKVRSEPEAHPVRTASATDEGRRLLGEGRTGLAVEAFQRALSSGEPTAPALNGLGVAYARLGRPEVALRLFQEAVIINPSDPRFAANLVKAMQAPELASREMQAAEAAARSEMAKADKPAEAAPGRLVRVSSNEYRLRTVAPAPTSEVAMRSSLDQRFKPIVRIRLASVPKEPSAQPRQLAMNNPYVEGAKDLGNFKPLMRIVLPEARPMPASAESAN